MDRHVRVRFAILPTHLGARDGSIVLHTVVVVVARAWCLSVNRRSKLLAHAVMDVSLGLFRLVLAGARICLHLKWVDVGLHACCVLGTGLSVNCMLILARTRLLDALSFETLILARGPRRC